MQEQTTEPTSPLVDSAVLGMMLASPASIVALKDAEGRYRFANAGLADLAGQDATALLGQTDRDLFGEELAERLGRLHQRACESNDTAAAELQLPSPQGDHLHLVMSFPVPGGADSAEFSIGLLGFDLTHVAPDLTQLHQNLQAMEAMNRDLRETMAELEQQASIDRLTGLWNRTRLDEAVVNEQARQERYGHPVSMALLDIDHFKQINDEYSHNTGDAVLRELAREMRRIFRRSDVLARWGGEEFVALLPNTQLSGAALLAERARERIAEHIFPTVGRMTVSIGVAECLPGECWEDWFDRADGALYRAKKRRNRVQVSEQRPFSGMSEHVGGQLLQLTWRDAYASGNALIDEQHRGLFQLANELLDAMLAGLPADDVQPLVDRLIAEVVRHFQDEERILRDAGFAQAEEHALVHRELIDSAISLSEKYRAGTLNIGELFQFLAHDVVAKHMLSKDREFFPCLQLVPQVDP